jgi:hypothetical protein
MKRDSIIYGNTPIKINKIPRNWKDEIYTHSSAILSFDEIENPNVDTKILYYYLYYYYIFTI